MASGGGALWGSPKSPTVPEHDSLFAQSSLSPGHSRKTVTVEKRRSLRPSRLTEVGTAGIRTGSNPVKPLSRMSIAKNGTGRRLSRGPGKSPRKVSVRRVKKINRSKGEGKP